MTGGGASRARSRSLLVVDDVRGRLVPLPEEGLLDIGVHERAGLRITARGVMPIHARLEVRPDRVVLSRVDPQGEIRVNDEPVADRRELWPGDVLALGEGRIEYRDVTGIAHPVREAQDFHVRLQEEMERCRRRHEPLALLLVSWSSGEVAAEAARRVAGLTRFVDVVGILGEREIGILLPGTDRDFRVPAGRVLRGLERDWREVRLGAAVAPRDGLDAATLLAAARFALGEARPGQVHEAGASIRRVTLGTETLVIADPAMHRLFRLVERLAVTDLPVLITGETGTGKELVAMALHHWSGRRQGPFVPLNCAAITDSLFESEVFGHERGAFTDARIAKPGLVEMASGGTLFLDEVGELSPQAQAKMLRILETMRVTRVGSVVERAIDVRIVAASNRDLTREVESGRFRRDLYYRLAAASVEIPPLRDRPLDIPALCEEFLSRARAGGVRITEGAMRRILLHDWPGNVRELRHVLARCLATRTGDAIDSSDLPREVGSRVAPWLVSEGPKGATPDGRLAQGGNLGPPPSRGSLREQIREMERARIREALLETQGVRIEAARILGMPLRTLQARIREYGIEIPSSRRRRPASALEPRSREDP